MSLSHAMNSFVPGSPRSSNLQDPPSDRTLGCSLFLCGLPPTSALLSLLDWKDVGSGPDHRVEKARLQLQGGSVVTLFCHVPREDSSPDITPEHLHESLNLSGGKSGFLFVHDASNRDVEASVRSLRDSIELQRRHGSRGFWVAVSTAQGASVSNGVRNDLVARFRDELASAGMADAPAVAASLDCVLEMPVVDAARMVGDALLAAPRPSRPGKPERGAPSGDEMTDHAFRHAFLRGNITPWTHMDYLRAAYITLLEYDVRDLDLLEVATIFATRMDRFRRRNSHAQHPPEPRTLTVFWLYHVRLALVAMLSFSVRGPTSFKGIFRYFPELADERLPSTYFSPDVLASSYSRDYWMLPNLRELVELVQYRDSQFRHKLTRPQHEEPHRLLRFAFAVVQMYLRPGEKTRRRAWFINLALDSLRRQTMRLRSQCPGVPAYSETQSHFYLHLVHAALLPLTLGNTHLLQNMTYPLFEETFRIPPSAWTAYYSPQLWDSIPARARFHPPDLQPLPDTVSPANFHLLSTHPSPNGSFRRAGLVPELPSLEVLQFYRAVLLEEAKPIGETPTPAEVTSHAHLLKYIHAHLVLATPPPAPPDRSSVSHHLDLLTTASTLPRDYVAFYLSHAVALLGNRTTGDDSDDDDNDIKDDDKKSVPLPDGRRMLSSAAAAPWGAPSGSGRGQGQGQRPARWEEWAGGESALVLCWDEAWCSALGRVNGPGLPEGRGGEVWSRVEEGDDDRDGEGEGVGGEQDDENDTLPGGEGEEEGWEVMSAATTLIG